MILCFFISKDKIIFVSYRSHFKYSCICHLKICKIKCSILFYNYFCSSSGCCIFFIVNFYFADAFNVCRKFVSCSSVSRNQLTCLTVICCRHFVSIYCKFCNDRNIDSVGICNYNFMCSQSQKANCKFSVCTGNFCSVYSILCIEISRQYLVKCNCSRRICIHDICYCCFNTCGCLNFYIRYIKSNDSFICVISNTVDGFSHD